MRLLIFLQMLSLSFAALVRQQLEEKRALLQIGIIIGNYEWDPCYMEPIYPLELVPDMLVMTVTNSPLFQ